MKKLLFILLAIIYGACCTLNKSNSSLQGASLTSTHWYLVSIESATMSKDARSTQQKIWIKLDTENKVTGFGGCNDFSSSYKLEGTTLQFSAIARTKVRCNNIATEDTFIGILEKVNKYKLEKNKLFFYNDERLLASFNPI